MQWWNAIYKPDSSKMLKPLVKPTDYMIFATLQRMQAIKASIPDLYAYGNAIWVAELYYRGDIMDMAIKSTVRRQLIEGELHRKLHKLQKLGKMWLRRIGGVLCGPDLFWERVIIPLGPDFYFGTMSGEMQMLLNEGKSFAFIMRYDFEACKRMKNIRRREKKHGKAITGVKASVRRGIKRDRANRKRIRFVR